MPTPQAPASMEDFKTQAQTFITKAKGEGKSNTAIANTLKFMFGLTQQAIENQVSDEMTPYEQETSGLARDKFEFDKMAAGYGDENSVLSQIEFGDGGQSSPSLFDAEGNLTSAFEDLFNNGGTTTPTSTFNSSIMDQLSAIDNPKLTRYDPVIPDANSNFFNRGSNVTDVNLSGVDLSGVDFGTPYKSSGSNKLFQQDSSPKLNSGLKY